MSRDFNGKLTYAHRSDGTYVFAFEGILNNKAVEAIKVMLPVLEQVAEENEKGPSFDEITRMMR